MGYSRRVKKQRSLVGKGAEEGEGKLEKLLMEMREENKMRWMRLEESLGEIKKELDRMKSREEEWKRERKMMEERIQRVEKKIRGKSRRGRRW